MRLAKLKLAGFKSFVDPTTVLAPGRLVGIVGPNGCGKSNLIDAVRWVLGESRASALRGESMQDVIFSGSTTRKPVSRASVELVFDNAEGRAAGQWRTYAEIAVKRQVDRSGDSDYFINNVRVRRKDVIDLLLGTGLGPRAYAIIEQGMISRVIEAKPEEVRAFLEEAAGVTKYKERRRETEGRLGDARDNLARVEDIRAELGAQIDKLAVQTEVARRYQDLNATLAQRQVLLWRLKYTQSAQEQDALRDAVSALAAQIDANNARLHEVDAQLLIARERQTVLADALSAAQGDLFSITNEQTRIEGEIKTLKDTHARLTQRGSQLLAEQQQWCERLERLEAEEAQWAESRVIALERLDASRELAGDQDAQVPQLEAVWREAQQRLEACRRDIALAEQHARVADTQRAAAMRSLDALASRRARLESERAGLHPEDALALATLEEEVEELSARQHEAQSAVATLQGRSQEAQARQQEALRAQQTAEREATAVRARRNALLGLQASLRDQGDVAGWLRQAGLHEEAAVWQSLKVAPGWELAVEAVLRERVGALGPLASERLATCLDQPAPALLGLLREAQVAPAVVLPFTGKALRELVQCARAEVQPYLEQWLAGVYVVDDLAEWLHPRMSVPPGVVLVNKAGQMLSAEMLTLFAPDAATHGALERQREIEQLELALAQADEALHSAAEGVDASATLVQQVQGELAEARRTVQAVQAQVHERSLAFVKAQQAQARHEERVEQLAREVAELAEQDAEERAQLEEAELARAQAEARLETLQDTLDELAQAAQAQEFALQSARDVATNAARRRQEDEFAVREAEMKLGDIARNLALTRTQLAKNVEERERLEAEQGALDGEALRTALHTALDLRHAREAALAARRQELDGANQRLREMDEERMRLDQALAPMREQINELRLRSQAAELARQQAGERLGELGAEVVMLEPAVMGELKETALSREVSRLGREIAELGPVNLAALVELEAAQERKRFLDVQYEDLMGAIETLESAIRRIDRETREQLMSTYETVNRHFGELFPRLFGGGEAQLVLSGDEILDAGVHIVARPPGKKNTSIHLLSGGEKALTAIALVFAMFQLNPAPFCMLDEVDAPLDDANTERYCEMVKHMSAVTQFVFISHSKITMEMAQQLVGVTMQEQGVSRVVEVDMEQALKLAQPEAA